MPVYERKKPTKDGRKYFYRCYYKDKYGNTKQNTSKFYKGIRECERAERDFLQTVLYEDIPDYEISFENVYREWLDYKSNVVKSSTYYCLKHRFEKHVLPFFKPYKLHSIKIKDLVEWRDKFINQDLCLDNKNRIIKSFKELLEYARDNFNFDGKVITKLQPVLNQEVARVNKSKWNYWTYEEFSKFIDSVNNPYYNLLFTFLYFTGLRIGECTALKWTDVNFEEKTLSINKTLCVKIEKQKYIITSPKTTNSIRIIDLDDNLISRLKDHYNNEKNIPCFNDNMFIFGNVTYLKETTVRRNLNKYIALAEVKKITIHGFRHSHASLLIDLGLDFMDVAERIGDSPRMVQDTYYHLFPKKKSRTVFALNSIK